jgi:hypothetical protein
MQNPYLQDKKINKINSTHKNRLKHAKFLFYPCGREGSIQKDRDENPQALDMPVFYTLIKQPFRLHAQEQDCPMPGSCINGSEPAQNSPNGQ